jgi:hypothetical protein
MVGDRGRLFHSASGFLATLGRLGSGDPSMKFDGRWVSVSSDTFASGPHLPVEGNFGGRRYFELRSALLTMSVSFSFNGPQCIRSLGFVTSI